ncbi:hypothetical protein ACQ86O_04335 [Serratia sp. L9]|uniref:hypothetical protein n=1 Tax=Serratia sp. L9 TaxID=3423946 RepID=UPI003D66E547
MKQNTHVFTEILATCTLVAMRGIIPSLLAFQDQLKQRIEQFCQGLEAEKQDARTIDALRRLICLVVDIHARQGLEAQRMSWHSYELEHVFYGRNDSPLLTEQHVVMLFNAKDKAITHYALQLFALSPVPLPGDELRPSLELANPDVVVGNPIQPAEVAQSFEPAPRRDHGVPVLAQFLMISTVLALLWFICRQYLMGGYKCAGGQDDALLWCRNRSR